VLHEKASAQRRFYFCHGFGQFDPQFMDFLPKAGDQLRIDRGR
jgi:hypothetical protein